jgi:hypothetical protein
LWKDLLCIAGSNKGKQHGFVLLAGRIPTSAEISRSVGASVEEVDLLLAELEKNGVFNRDRQGAIYCRRMVRAQKNRKNGRLGGNPKLLKSKPEKNPVKPAANHPPVQVQVKEDSFLNLGDEIQKEPPRRRKRKPALPFPEGDWLAAEDVDFAKANGISDWRATFEKFKNHALQNDRQCRDWHAAWRNWVTSPYQQQESKNGTYRNGGQSSGRSAGHRTFASFALAEARKASEKNG